MAALQNITDYGGKKGKWLITGEVVETSWYLGGYNPYYKGWLLAKHMAVWQDMKVKEEGGVLVLKPVYAVNSSWFNSNLSVNFSNTIILNISYYSAKTDDLWNVFKDKSAGAYFGFTDVTSGGFGLSRGWELIEKLREGDLTTGEAYQPEFDPHKVGTHPIFLRERRWVSVPIKNIGGVYDEKVSIYFCRAIGFLFARHCVLCTGEKSL